MHYKLSIRPDAKYDANEAFVWYESKRTGLGDEFVASLRELLTRIVQTPLLFAKDRHGVHGARIGKFPYEVYYLIELDVVDVVAVMHGNRHPRNWQSRI
jgi:plasmid stabilization system protein ParE